MCKAEYHSMDHRTNPFRDWATIVDCGDVANSPFDKFQALKQLTRGATEILTRKSKEQSKSEAVRLITIGGDHTISECIPFRVRKTILTLFSTTSASRNDASLGARGGFAFRFPSRYLGPSENEWRQGQ